MKLASGFCIPEPLPVHTGIKGRQVHPHITFLLRSRVDEKCADLHKPFISYLFLVGVTVQSSVSLSAAIPLSTSTKRANSKRANHGWSRLFQVESVRELVFFSPRRPPKMHDWSSAFFPARKVRALAVTLHLEVYVASMQWMAGPWESMISSWGSWTVPGGWTSPGHHLCPLGISLSSWLDFRGAPLSCWTQSCWNSCLLIQCSWPRSLPSKRSGTSKRFR